ncbi:MAG: DUF1989 domain-containing protein [Roseibium sp.]
MSAPQDAAARRSVQPVICYPNDSLPQPDLSLYGNAREQAEKTNEVIVPPREAASIEIPAGHFLKITSIEGPQVGDLNLFNSADLSERFYSGKTRALHGTHVTTGDRLWSNFPTLRPMATVTTDTLNWYGIDEFGGSVHDVIGTRCDPYTGRVLEGPDYHHCCHSNLTRALADARNINLQEAEPHVHDVLNVFMCTGFTRDSGQYFMKASPVRPGDYLELFAEIDILAVMSACPGGDCGSEHSSDTAPCHPMLMEVYRPQAGKLDSWSSPSVNPYDRSHGR